MRLAWRALFFYCPLLTTSLHHLVLLTDHYLLVLSWLPCLTSIPASLPPPWPLHYSIILLFGPHLLSIVLLQRLLPATPFPPPRHLLSTILLSPPHLPSSWPPLTIVEDKQKIKNLVKAGSLTWKLDA